jgi:hypothetical protein
MKAIRLGGFLAVLVGAAAGFAQEKKSEPCGMAGIFCPKDGKCAGECRTICDRAGATLKAVRAKAVEKTEAKFGSKCECTSGECGADGCPGCEMVKTKIFIPLMKERVGARMKDFKKDVMHAVKDREGKPQTAKCTFLKGDVCGPCVDEMSDAVLKKLQEFATRK